MKLHLYKVGRTPVAKKVKAEQFKYFKERKLSWDY